MNATKSPIEKIIDSGGELLESRRGFDRYETNVEAEESAWFCTECGSKTSDPMEGCDECGFGQADPDDDSGDLDDDVGYSYIDSPTLSTWPSLNR